MLKEANITLWFDKKYIILLGMLIINYFNKRGLL